MEKNEIKINTMWYIKTLLILEYYLKMIMLIYDVILFKLLLIKINKIK